MKKTLQIFLFGGLLIKENGQPVTKLVSKRAEAIVAYLAYTQKTCSREALAELFWDDRQPGQAMTNLRVVLSSLRKHLKSYLLIDRHTVAINPQNNIYIDSAEFMRLVKEGQAKFTASGEPSAENADPLAQAIQLYQNDFLSEFHLRESRGFEEWALLERERLRRLMLETLQTLATNTLNNGTYKQSLLYLNRLLKLDPLHEKAHRQKMLILARTGQRSAALKQYLRCKEILFTELGVTPMSATSRLYNKIRLLSETKSANLPQAITPFIGRNRELKYLHQQIINPQNRLITLIGPGGIGKTRLAIEVARQAKNNFLHGVCFVPLAAVHSASFLPVNIANALKINFQNPNLKAQLIDHLRERELLLVLDNFEQISQSGINLLLTILNQAPEITLLVTSRERLQLKAELIFDIGGLDIPPTSQQEQLQDFSAVMLFINSAKRLKNNQDFTKDDLLEICRACQMVEGMPLAIELAASWSRSLSCAEIVRQIENDPDFLSASWQDVPQRHRSIRAVFNHSWRLLTAQEQAVFKALSLFQECFSGQAAQAVSNARPAILAGLVDKSMLQLEGEARYNIHSLLKQYAYTQLAQKQDQLHKVQSSHALYYAHFLHKQEEALLYKDQARAIAKIREVIDDIRLAWDWAIKEQSLEVISLAQESVGLYYWGTSQYTEARDMFAQAILSATTTNNSSRLLAQLYLHLAEFEVWLGQYEQAEINLNNSLALLNKADNNKKLYGNILQTQGMLSYFQGQFSQARGYFEQSLAIFRKTDYQYGIAQALNTLANTLCDENAAYQQAQALYEESLSIASALGDQYGIAKVYINLSELYFPQQEYERAKKLAQKSLRLYQSLNYSHGIAACLNTLARITSITGEYEEAKNLIEQGLELNLQTGQQQQIVISLKQMGKICLYLQQYDEAGDYYKQALQMASQLGVTHLILDILVGLANLYIARGQQKRALYLATLLKNQTIDGQELKTRVDTTFSAATAQFSKEELALFAQNRQPTSLEIFVTTLLNQ